MKVLSILLTLVNSWAAGLVLLSCMSVFNLSWEGLGWLGARIVTGILVILSGGLIFRDGIQPIGPRKLLMAGLTLIPIGVSSAMWGLHLTLISGDVKNVMILFGGSLVLQGIASIVGLQESGGMTV
ncbi:MAG: hypothetical protein PVJ21_20855 [Anaerolineales bacterium]|jgi:hypothetical protein